MKDLKGLRVVVAGAGAVGSVTALSLAWGGAQVVLADPAGRGDNASGVAAGMLAPLFETLLDPVSADHYALLEAGRDGWPGVLEAMPAAPALDRSGAALQVADTLQGEIMLARARSVGAVLEPLEADDVRRRLPGLAAPGPFLFTPDDWRLQPHAMLEALHAALDGAGGRRLRASVARMADGRVHFAGAEPLEADVLVMATGLGAGLKPIKGQILRFPGRGPTNGPVLRAEGVYAAPSAQGLVVGASMEEGLSDRGVDAAVVERMRAAAVRLFPALAGAAVAASAGVRAATRDGLPLVGIGGEPGVILAQGARRNGWLLAPLIAQVVIDHLAGRPVSAAARAFDPARLQAGSPD
jgi:glycine oxidase